MNEPLPSKPLEAVDPRLEVIALAVKLIGGQTATALALETSPQMVNQWVKGKRPIPTRFCPEIERLTNRRVRCEQLDPDVNWAFVRDSSVQESLELRKS